jgi:hypothetical protein
VASGSLSTPPACNEVGYNWHAYAPLTHHKGGGGDEDDDAYVDAYYDDDYGYYDDDDAAAAASGNRSRTRKRAAVAGAPKHKDPPGMRAIGHWVKAAEAHEIVTCFVPRDTRRLLTSDACDAATLRASTAASAYRLYSTRFVILARNRRDGHAAIRALSAKEERVGIVLSSVGGAMVVLMCAFCALASCNAVCGVFWARLRAEYRLKTKSKHVPAMLRRRAPPAGRTPANAEDGGGAAAAAPATDPRLQGHDEAPPASMGSKVRDLAAAERDRLQAQVASEQHLE